MNHQSDNAVIRILAAPEASINHQSYEAVMRALAEAEVSIMALRRTAIEQR